MYGTFLFPLSFTNEFSSAFQAPGSPAGMQVSLSGKHQFLLIFWRVVPIYYGNTQINKRLKFFRSIREKPFPFPDPTLETCPYTDAQ